MARFPRGSKVIGGVVTLDGKPWVPKPKWKRVKVVCHGPGLCERACGPFPIPEGEDPPSLCPYDGHLVTWDPVKT